MASPAEKKLVLVRLEMDSFEGGSSPWFNSKGRSAVDRLTTEPGNADLFSELARDGTMGALVSYLDTEQPWVGNVALLCYVVLGLALISLFVLLPVTVYRRCDTSAVGLMPCLLCVLVLLGCAAVQMICLMSMISTRNGMDESLRTKAPQAYEWTFELLRNYTELTVRGLKKAEHPDKTLDKTLTATANSIEWLKGNATAWEESFAGYDSLKNMVTGRMSSFQIALLSVAISLAVSSALLTCSAWNRRKRNLERGVNSPAVVAYVAVTGTYMLLAHLVVALPMIARWLPVCVLADTYLCAPYRRGSFVVIDDGVARLWPRSSRPDPFCRLVPSILAARCDAKSKTPIKALPTCPSKAGKKTLDMPDDIMGETQLLQQHAPQPNLAVSSPGKDKTIGDCFYPYKIVDTDMTAMCPLFTDDLVAHWMALVVSVVFGLLGAMAAGALAIIYLATGEKKVAVKEPKKVVLKKRVTKKKAKRATPPLPPTPLPTPPPPPPPAEPVHIEVQVPEPVPVPVLSMRPRRRPKPPSPVIVIPPQTCSHPPPSPPPVHPALMPPPLFVPPPMVAPIPHFAMPPAVFAPPPPPSTPPPMPKIMESCSGENQQSAVAYTNVNASMPPPMVNMMPQFAMPPAAFGPPPRPSTPSPIPQIMASCSGENQQSAVAYTNVNVCGGGASGGVSAWPYAPGSGMTLTLPQARFAGLQSSRPAGNLAVASSPGTQLLPARPSNDKSKTVQEVVASRQIVQHGRGST